MGTAPWRCSQCGTVNEPVANSCRTCGKWPSLFDLEDGVVEDGEIEAYEEPELPAYEPDPAQIHEAPEPLTVDVEPFDPQPTAPRRRFEPPPTDPVLGEGEGQGRPKWVSWIVPLAIVGYLVLSYAFSGR